MYVCICPQNHSKTNFELINNSEQLKLRSFELMYVVQIRLLNIQRLVQGFQNECP